MWSYNYVEDNELYHYGVLGMKWGVHRAISKSASNSRLQKKAYNYDKKAAQLLKKSEKIHSKEDLEGANQLAIKSANYSKKAATMHKRALKADAEYKKALLEKRAQSLEYKSSKTKMGADRISKTTGYGIDAMSYLIKSDNASMLAAKARMKISSNNAYIAKMKRKASSLSQEEIQNGYDFVERLKNLN